MKQRTICEAIEVVLSSASDGMTCKEIYNAVIERQLYEFNAKDPQGVLRLEIRRHCEGIEFPSASPIKCFKLLRNQNNTNYYALNRTDSYYEKIEDMHMEYVLDIEDEVLPEEKMVGAYKHYIGDLKHVLLEKVRACHPSFLKKW